MLLRGAGWDHTPRSKREGLVFTNTTPELFRIHVREVLKNIENKPEDHNLVFLKSWNEWAEGNYMEPDLKWGTAFLDVLGEELQEK